MTTAQACPRRPRPVPGPACGSSMTTCTGSTAPSWPSSGAAAAPGCWPGGSRHPGDRGAFLTSGWEGETLVHILVVDDFVLVELALAQVIQDTPHTLVGVRDPRSLPDALGQETHFDLALVDINFGPGVPTGLTAVRILQDLSPDTKIVIESTDEERNRLLFLLAAFAFFEPLGLMSKASSSAEMRTLIDAIDRGDLAGPGLLRPPGTLRAALSPVQRLVRNVGLLDELIRNGTDLI